MRLQYTFFFFNDTASPKIYPLSLHDALPISVLVDLLAQPHQEDAPRRQAGDADDPETGRLPELLLDQRPQPAAGAVHVRSEEHTSELQSRQYLVCRLLLEKKKKTHIISTSYY